MGDNEKIGNGGYRDYGQYFLRDGSRILNGPLIQSNINGIDIGNGIAEDIDLVTVNEGSADALRPRLFWDEATDSFEMNKSLTLPGGSLKIGDFTISEDIVDADGLKKHGSFHIHPSGGIAGSICLHEGAEPACSGNGDGHRLWVDQNHNLKWQNESGVSQTIGLAFDEADPIFAAWDRNAGISITESQISDLQDYLLAESDPVFSAWDKSAGISITESQISDLSHFSGAIADLTGDGPLQFPSATGQKINLYSDTYAFGVESGQLRISSNQDIAFYTGGYSGNERALLSEAGTFKVSYRIQTPILYNGDGILKIQPYANADIELFGDTDVANNENSKILKIWRRAQEGNDYIRFYISSSRKAYIHASNELTLQAQQPFTINSVTDDITFKVGDADGAKKFYFKDSGGVDVAIIDSNGNAWFDGDINNVDVALLSSNHTSLAESVDALTNDIGTNTEHRLATSGNPHSVSKSDLNLGNVDNTTDLNKPISSDTQSALDLKSPLDNPHFTGKVGIGTDAPHDELHIVATSPRIILEESDAGSSEKVWMIEVTNEEFMLKTASDLYTATQSIIKAKNRGGTGIGLVCVPNSDFSIGTDTPETSAALEIKSTDGAILIPRMTTTQRNNLTAKNGMMLYDTTQDAFRVYQAGAWKSI